VTLDVRRLGRVDYEAARALQHDLVERRARGDIPDTLLLCEHPPVVTLGRGTDPADVLDRRFPIVEVERGGEATYHGPGQVVGYAIRLLPPGRRDLHAHLRLLESVVVDAVARFGVVGRRREGATGVWTDDEEGVPRKLASIGVAARRWVAFHGFALNVATDLDAFSAVNPCGFAAAVMTSLERATGREVALAEVEAALERSAKAVWQSPG
jgi:lipoyl(octanoyl) transferase